MLSLASLVVIIAAFYPAESGLFGKKKSFVPPSVEWSIGGDPHEKDNGLGIYVEENAPKPRYELIYGDDIYLQKEGKSGFFLKAWQKYEYVGSFTAAKQEASSAEEGSDTKRGKEACQLSEDDDCELYIVLKYGRKIYSLPSTDLEMKLNDGSAQIKISIAKKFTKENHPKRTLPEWLTRMGDGKKMDEPPYFQGRWRGKIMKNKFDADLDGPLSADLKPLSKDRDKKFKKYGPKLFKNRKVSLDRSQEREGHILYKYSAKAQHIDINDMLYEDDEDEAKDASLFGPISVMMAVFAAVVCCLVSLCFGVISGFIASMFMQKQQKDGYSVAHDDVASNI